MNQPNTHFDGKEAVDHVIEKQVEGLISSTEVHGAEASWTYICWF